MQRIDISTLGLCEKYIVGEAGNVGLSSNLCMLLGTQIFSSSLSTATTWPHWVINKNPIDIQGQRFRQHLHVLWRQHTSARCHSESCLMFPLRLLTKPGTEFKFLGAEPLLVTDLKVSNTTSFLSEYDPDAATLQKQKYAVLSIGGWNLDLDLYALISTTMGIIILTYFIMGED